MDERKSQREAEVREKLSRTMRLDIVPESQVVPVSRDRAISARRLIARKAFAGGTPRVSTQGAAPDALGNAEFQELFESVYDAAIITDMSGGIVDANVRASNFLLYSSEEFLTLSILDIISGADASLVDTIRLNLVERFVLIEACYCARKDGTFFPAEVAVNQMRFSQHDFFCFFVRDITRRREAEEKLRAVSNAIENSHSGIAITDLTGIVQYVNPAVCRMWKYDSKSDVVGKDIRSLWRKTEDDDALIQSVSSLEKAWIRETSVERKDGSVFDLQVIAASNRDSDGKVVGIVFSLVDVSDRKRADEAMRETERQRVMLESLGAACHHLGQPATVLLANLGIIMGRQVADGDSVLRDLVGSCLKAAESLSAVLHKLNTMNEYRTTPYLENGSSEGGSRILKI